MKIPPGRYVCHQVFMPVALLAVLVTAACGGPDTTPTPEIRPTSTSQAQATVSVTQLPPAVTPHTAVPGGMPATDKSSLIDTLRKTFPATTPADIINQPFMSVPGTDLKLDDERFPTVQVYEYADEAASQKDASKIQPNGDISGFHVGWIAQPHFYLSGRIIVIYLGKDTAILSALGSAVGTPFAVGEDVRSSGTPKP